MIGYDQARYKDRNTDQGADRFYREALSIDASRDYAVDSRLLSSQNACSPRLFDLRQSGL
jgi:hypothetical protein